MNGSFAASAAPAHTRDEDAHKKRGSKLMNEKELGEREEKEKEKTF